MAISQQFHQLPMFMTGEELAALHSGDYGKRAGDVTPREYNQSHGVGIAGTDEYREGSRDHGSYIRRLRKSIEDTQGIQRPVNVWHPDQGPSTLVDGHHRVKIAQATGRLVPVEHHEGPLDKVHEEVFLAGLNL